MSFAENLQYLRKKEKITQEELAEELSVSRQSVSKWETGEAYPETEKIIILCDKFNVTMDELMRGEVNKKNCSEDFSEKEKDKDKIKKEFSEHMDWFSKRIGIGVTVIMIGIAFLLTFAGTISGDTDKIPLPLGVVGVVFGAIGVVCAVFIFIFSGINHDAFQREYPQIEDVFTADEKRAFDKKFALSMALILSGIGLAVAAFVLSFVLTEDLRRSSGNFSDDFISMTIVGVFLFVLSFLCGGVCYMGVQHSKYDVKEYNRDIAIKNKHIKFNKLSDAVCGAVMLTATGIYLLLGFVWNLWHPGWVVFPIGGIICAIITTFSKCVGRDKDNKDGEE